MIGPEEGTTNKYRVELDENSISLLDISNALLIEDGMHSESSSDEGVSPSTSWEKIEEIISL